MRNGDWQFVDLGSGVGRMCIQAAYQWGAAVATGVELSQSRHEVAVIAAGRAQRLGLVPKGSRLRFECEDLLLTQSLNAATTEPPTRTAKTENSACKVGVYVASLLFDPEMMVQLACLLERSSDVRWVATLQRLPLQRLRRPAPLHQPLRLDAVLSLPMSWDDEGVTELTV